MRSTITLTTYPEILGTCYKIRCVKIASEEDCVQDVMNNLQQWFSTTGTLPLYSLLRSKIRLLFFQNFI